MPLAEDAVGDIAEEREAGDEHHDQPQLLRVPCAQRAIMTIRQERQDRAGNDGVTGERLHVVLVELLEEAVQFRLQRQNQRHHGGARDRKGGLAEARRGSRDRPLPGRRSGVVASGVALMAGRLRITDRQDGGAPGDERAGGERLSELPSETRQSRRKADQGEGTDAGNASPGREVRAGRNRAQFRSAARKRAPSRRTAPASTSPAFTATTG